MGVFKSYDIRGIYGREWDREIAYRIGFNLPGLLRANEVLVGRDVRLSTPEVFAALSAGITDAGSDVVDIGLCTTPAVYFATAYYDLPASVMITASHNPKEYNGLKISGRQAVPVGYETGLAELEQMIRQQPAPGGRKGSVRALDIRRDYMAHLAPYKKDIREIKAVVDCSDGMAGIFLHDVVDGIPGEIVVMYDVPDGSFPHHAPNPLQEENLADLKRRTRDEGAELGICFDGDGDRVMFIDERGKFVSPDLIIALLGLYFLAGHNRGRVVTYDVRSSRSVVEFVEKLGGRPTICPVGHSYAKKLLRETDGIYGGELAGHYYFRDNYYCDSGMIAALLVLSILSRESESFSQLIAQITKYHYSGEINFKTAHKDLIIESVLNEYRNLPGAALTDIDGIRLDFADWWVNLRKSNTEPYLRMVVEASSAESLAERTGQLKRRFKQLDPELEEE